MGFQEWIGRQESIDDLVTATPIAALSATLNWPAERPASGVPVPPLWHWLHFLPISPLKEAGPDGHPTRGGFLPPVPLPRRMWAGSRFVFLMPLLIGEKGSRVSTVKSITHKAGKSGVFLTEHYAMFPAAAVSGWYFAHPEAQYFAVGKVDQDQVQCYSKRKGQELAVTERWLAPNLGYDS